MHFDPKLTLDGLMTLIGGGLALIGVWWSNHRSTANLQKQLNEERVTRAGVAETEKIAMAKAILFEVDWLYHQLLTEVGDGEYLDRVHAASLVQFPIYDGNAEHVGKLDHALVEGIVRCYGAFAEHRGLLAYFARQLREATEDIKNTSMGDFRRLRLKGVQNEYEQYLVGKMPHLCDLATRVCSELCEFTKVPKSRVRVFGSEKPVTLEAHAQKN